MATTSTVAGMTIELIRVMNNFHKDIVHLSFMQARNGLLRRWWFQFDGLYSTLSPRASIRAFASFNAQVCMLVSGL